MDAILPLVIMVAVFVLLRKVLPPGMRVGC